MANKPFDREIINVRERPFSSDINLSETYSDLALRDVIKSIFSQRASFFDSTSELSAQACFWGSSLKVTPAEGFAMSVIVSKGIGFVRGDSDPEIDIGSVLGLNDFSTLKPIPLSSNMLIGIDSVEPGFKQTSIIEVKADHFNTDLTSREVFDGVGFSPSIVRKTFSWSLDGRLGVVASPLSDSTAAISLKKGFKTLLAGAEVIPQTTPGYTKIAEILVRDTDTSLTSFNIRDTRKTAAPYGQVVVSGRARLKNATIVSSLPSSLYAEILEVNAPPGIEVRSTLRNHSARNYTISVIGDFSTAQASVTLGGKYLQSDTYFADINQGISNVFPAGNLQTLSLNVIRQWFLRYMGTQVVKVKDAFLDVFDGSLRDQLNDSTRTQPVINISGEQKIAAINFSLDRRTAELDTDGVVVSCEDDCIVDFVIILS